MELLISLGMAAVLAAVLTAQKRSEKTANAVSVKRRITEINTLLQNVEVYDGTSKGQKKIGGDL